MPGTFLSNVQGFTPVIDVLANEVGLGPAAVYGVVWRYCQGPYGVCQASLETIGGHLGLNWRTVHRHIKSLVRAGYLQDLTPELRNHPHVYADTGRAVIEGLVQARVQTKTETVASALSNCHSTPCQIVIAGESALSICHSGYDKLSYEDRREIREEERKENMGSAMRLDAISLWQASKCILKEQVPLNVFDTWLENSEGITLDDRILVVGVHSPYAKDWLENRLYSQIQRAASDVRGSSTSVRFVVSHNVGKGERS